MKYAHQNRCRHQSSDRIAFWHLKRTRSRLRDESLYPEPSREEALGRWERRELIDDGVRLGVRETDMHHVAGEFCLAWAGGLAGGCRDRNNMYRRLG
jgi:hypothetical protein